MSRDLIVEGGSSNSATEQRRGFVDFLRAAGVQPQPRVRLAGPRHEAIRQYLHRPSPATLLVDSEEAVSAASSVDHLLERGDINMEQKRQMRAHEVFLMVETMESWLIADIESIVQKHQRVNSAAIVKKRASVAGDVEKISKEEAERLLSDAFPSGRLDSKGTRMRLIGYLNPDRVRSASPEAARFLDSFTT